ncbi:MAG: ABC transporter substrate-binding protein [Actinomycetota bacterium]|nr:MAG: putative ABC transporter substrate-binding protein [Acidimicrobiaceae bacterium]
MFRFRRATALSAALLLTLAACGDDSTSSDPTTPPATVAATAPASAAPAESPATEAPPATATADIPEAIVSLSPSATEILFAIGAGDQVIAVDDQSNYPPEAEAKMTDLSGYTPNVEAIAALGADLVVHDGSTDLGGQLDGLGIANWVGSAAMTFDDIYAQIEQLGVATGHIGEAAELVGQMQADIDAAVAANPTLEQPLSFYHELDPTFFSVTSNTFIGQVYGLFGLRNIADTAEGGTDYPQLSAEFIISQNPDLVFLADGKCCGESVDSVKARAGWDVIGAVSTGGVIVVDDDIASRWGPRVVELVQIIGAAVTEAAALSAA